MMGELKYLMGLLVPAVAFVSLYFDGMWSYFAITFAFVLIPLLELVLPQSTQNFTKEEEQVVKKKAIYDWLVYINVPLQYGLLALFLFKITGGYLAPYEIIGKITAMGLGCGIMGINVAHELGHRHKKSEQLMAKALLLTTLYMHFFIEHNRGHHKNISTPLDPASSRKGENIYSFFFRSVTGGYLSAWHLENSRLKKKGVAVLSLQNEMVRYSIIQFVFTLLIFLIFGVIGLLGFLGASIFGFLLLETVNYIEHYGLQRKEIKDGVYEKTQPWHSWNSNHPLGRLVLYELTRHSDHHYHAGRKYQVLRHFDDAPQMPTGYPGMMVCALIPPLWFKIMNNEVAKHEQTTENLAKAA
ncbi:MAG: alkane 1-monooxygenase [Chitinophagales bacterium]